MILLGFSLYLPYCLGSIDGSMVVGARVAIININKTMLIIKVFIFLNPYDAGG